jgi:hypothetical protein
MAALPELNDFSVDVRVFTYCLPCAPQIHSGSILSFGGQYILSCFRFVALAIILDGFCISVLFSSCVRISNTVRRAFMRMTTTLLVAACTLLAVTLPLQAATLREVDDAGSTLATAQSLDLPPDAVNRIVGRFSLLDRSDVYSFSLGAGSLRFSVTEDSLFDANIVLYDGLGLQLFSGTQIDFSSTVAGTYFLEVFRTSTPFAQRSTPGLTALPDLPRNYTISLLRTPADPAIPEPAPLTALAVLGIGALAFRARWSAHGRTET